MEGTESVINDDPRDPLESELLVPADDRWLLSLGSTESSRFDETDRSVLEEVVTVLEAALTRLAADGSQHPQQRESDAAVDTDTQQCQQLESFQQAIEETADGIAILDDGEFSYIDQTHVEMYGFDSREQLLGDTWRVLYDDEDVQRLENEAVPALESDGHWQGKLTGRRQDGSTFPAEVSLTSVGDDRLVCTVRDKSEQRAKEQELELKERAMDEANVSIQITDPTQENNPLVYVNEAFERITGYTTEDAIGRNPRFLQGEETDPEKRARLRESIDSEEPVTMELRNTRADGTEYWAKLSITPVYDDDGKLTNYIGIQQDVTDRRQLAETLKNRTERLELALSGTGTGIAELDLETGSVTWDKTLRKTFGRNPKTVEDWIEIIHPEDRENAQARLDEMLETGEPWNGTFRVITGSGEVAWLETRAVPVHEDGEPSRVLATGTDVTDRKDRTRWLQRLFEYGPLLFVQTRLVDGEPVVTNCNEPFAERLGYEPEDVIDEPLRTFYRPASVANLQGGAYERALGDGLEITDRELETSDGEAVPCLLRAIPRDTANGTVGTDALFVDISERVENKRELELKERAMDEANVGITISDPRQPDNPLIYVNEEFVEQTGYSREEALGKTRRFLYGDDRDQPALDTLREAIEAEEPVTVELRNYRKDGDLFWNRLSVTPVYDDAGELVNYIGIQQDVTEQKVREQRLRALHETTRTLLETDNPQEAVSVTANALFEKLGVKRAGVYLREGDELVREMLLGPLPKGASERVPRGQTPLWEAFEADEPVVYEDVADIDDGVTREDLATSAYFPVAHHGVVAVGADDAAELDDEDRRFIELLMSNLTAVLDTLERQRELAEERERFRLLTESVDEYAFLIVDENGTIQTWNESAADLFGYDAEAAVGMSMAQLHTDANRERELPDRLLQQARVAGESAHEGPQVRADGSEFYADTRCAPLETDDGSIHGYGLVVRDMTDRRQRERRTELFVENSDDVVAVLDTDGTLTYVSGSARRVLGYEPSALVGENLFDYIHSSDREAVMDQFFASTDEAGTSTRAECRFKSGDGEWLTVDGRCENMLDEDAVGGMLLYLRDVTESKERTRQLEAIFNGTFQFTGVLDPDGTVLEVNDAIVDFVTAEREEVVGEPLSDAPWWEQNDDRVREAVSRAADGEFVRYETTVNGKDGLATVDFSVKPVTDDDGDVTLLIGEGRDITDFERQRQHLEVVQRVMRHNIRNDLTKLRAWAKLMSEESDPQQRAAQFERVRGVLDKWEAMTEKLKQIRQSITARDASRADTDPPELLEDIATWGEETYPEATVRATELDTGEGRVPSLVKNALAELLDNAISATEENPPDIELSLSRPDDGWIEIDVRDNGPGMPDTEAEVLETGEETQLIHGGGLGLWMVRMLVKQSGGDVSVNVTETGTRVCLRLPTTGSNTGSPPTGLGESSPETSGEF